MARQNKKPVRKPLGAQLSETSVRETLLLVLSGAIVFTAVLFYERPTGPIPHAFLRALHLSTLGYPADEATVVTEPTLSRARSNLVRTLEHPSGAGLDLNPFAPRLTSRGRTAIAGQRIDSGFGSGSPSISADSASGSGQNRAGGLPDGANGEILQLNGIAPPAGVTSDLTESQLAKVAYGLSAGANGGVKVEQVLPSSVAGQIGLKPGDVIVAVDGSPVDSPEQFARIYEKGGPPAQINVLRGGQIIPLHR